MFWRLHVAIASFAFVLALLSLSHTRGSRTSAASTLMNDALNAPRDLHSIQYAAWICENTIALPANKSNMEVISQAIEAIGKSKYREKKHPNFTAFLWLNRQCEFARLSKIETNHLFFLNGTYNEVREPEKQLPKFIPCKECLEGWRWQEKDGKCTGRVEQCECRRQWVAAAKVAK